MGLKELDGLAVVHGGQGGVVGEFQGCVELDGFEEDAGVHDEDHAGGAPLVVANVGLVEQEGAALFEFAQEATHVVDIVEAVAFEMGDALLGDVNPELAGHGFEGLGFNVVGIEGWVGLEGEPVAGAVRGIDGAGEGVEEGFGQGAEDFAGVFGVALLALLAVALEAGVVEEGLEAGLLGGFVIGGEGGVVALDEASDVAVTGFGNELGGGEARAGFAQGVAEGVGGVLGGGDFCTEDALDELLGLGRGERCLGQRAGQERGRQEQGGEEEQRCRGAPRVKPNCADGGRDGGRLLEEARRRRAYGEFRRGLERVVANVGTAGKKERCTRMGTGFCEPGVVLL